MGGKFLKITGILMIIGGIIGLIAGIVAVIGVGALAALGASKGLLVIAAILALISGIVELLAGLKGNKGSKDPALGAKCLPWGVCVLVLSIIGMILSKAGGGKVGVVSVIVGLIIPILYIVGALMMKKELPG